MMQVVDRRTHVGPMSPNDSMSIAPQSQESSASTKKVTSTHSSPTKIFEDKSNSRFNLWTSHSDDNAIARTQRFIIETRKNPIKFVKSHAPASAEVPYTPINDTNLVKKEVEASKSHSVNSDSLAITSTTILPESSSPQDKGEGSSRSGKGLGPSKHLYSHWISLHPAKNVSEKGIGLFNKGNTCYMNSTLQALMHLPPLSHAILTYERKDLYGEFGAASQKRFDAIGELATLTKKVLCIKSGGSRSISPDAFLINLKSYAAPLRQYRQEDAHEFLRFLLDALQFCSLLKAPKSLKSDDPLRETTLPFKIFGGRLRSRVQCQRCKHNSDTFEGMLDISLNLRGANSVKEALEHFTASDNLAGDKYRCEKCKRGVDATKQFTIHEPPVVLTLSLKRFSASGQKYNRMINYGESLNLTKDMLSEGIPPQHYRLRSIVHHQGSSVNSGHYVASVKGHTNNRWYEMDDDIVHSCQEAPINRKDAYILFYVLDPTRALEVVVQNRAIVNNKRRVMDDDDDDDDDEKNDESNRDRKRYDYSSSVQSSPSIRNSTIKKPILHEARESSSQSQSKLQPTSLALSSYKASSISPGVSNLNFNVDNNKIPIFRNMGQNFSSQSGDDTGKLMQYRRGEKKTEILHKRKRSKKRRSHDGPNQLGVKPLAKAIPKNGPIASPYKVGRDSIYQPMKGRNGKIGYR